MVTNAIVISEEWRPVVNWEGYYSVSSLGRVRSEQRFIQTTNGHSRSISPKILKPSGKVYDTITLCRDNRPETHNVHELVALAFIGPRPEGLDVLHNDGDHFNNIYTNLRYGTVSDNMLDTIKHGTNFNANKERCVRKHLLEPPNLTENRLPARICLACNKGRWSVNSARRRGKTLDLEEEIQRFYHQLMPDDVNKRNCDI